MILLYYVFDGYEHGLSVAYEVNSWGSCEVCVSVSVMGVAESGAPYGPSLRG